MIRHRSYLNLEVVMNSVACVLKEIEPITGEMFSGLNIIVSPAGNTVQVGFIDDTDDENLRALTEMAEDNDNLKVEVIASDGYERVSERVMKLVNPRITQIELRQLEAESPIMHFVVTISYDYVERFQTTIHG